MEEKKSVYVLLTQTGTVVSKCIKKITREPYSHVSISTDDELKNMYSFARRSKWNILNGGLIKENLNEGVFGRLKYGTKCRLYRIDVTIEQYEMLSRKLQELYSQAEKYNYNYFGLFSALVHYYPEFKHHFYCSQFVAYMLETSGIHILDKSWKMVRPQDFRKSEGMELLYDGCLAHYPMFYRKQKKNSAKLGKLKTA